MPQEELAGRVLLAEVRRALHHLYDPIELRKSPLIALFGLDSHSSLRQVLEQGVAALKPGASVSQQSDAWRTYRVLHHRYIEQFDQNDVAGNLNLSIRQLRRQEGVALQSIADLLCERFGLNCVADPVDVEAAVGDSATTAEYELALAERAYPSRPTDLAPVLEAVRDTLKPMADALGVALAFEPPPRAVASIRVNASPQPLRQALLTALPGMLQRSQAGALRAQVAGDETHVTIVLRAEPAGPPAAADLAPEDAARFHEDVGMARRLLAMCNGELSVDDAGRTLTIRVPVAETVPVLVVDDNADAHALFARFLADSRYQLIGAQSAAQAEVLLRGVTPRVIVLDVMLPEVDGWEMLGRLRENPQTSAIPVIVCTILPQEKLALTLSAAAFLRKPVKQAQLLALLDQLTGASVTESR